MYFYIEAALSLLGILIIVVGRFPVGRFMIRNPMAALVGGALAVTLPVAIFIWGYLGITDRVNAFRANKSSASVKEAQKAYFWIDPAIIGTTLALAGVALFIAVRMEEEAAANRPSIGEPDADDGLAHLPDGVNQYRGVERAIPPEVLELGSAQHLHPPWRLLTWLRKKRVEVTLAGLLLSLSAIIMLLLLQKRAGLAELIVIGVTVAAGAMIMALPYVQFDIGPSYAVYPGGLVIIQGDDFTVIPWQDIKEFRAARRSLATSNGQTFEVHRHTQDIEGLLGRIEDRVRSRQLPAAMATIEAGGTLTFGPFVFSAAQIGYRGETLPWSKVKQLKFSGNVLVIQPGGWQCDLDSLPNGFILREVIRRVCPLHLGG